MGTPSGEGEGQALARRLLDAIDAGARPDWDAFHSAYGPRLSRVAGRWLSWSDVLRSEFGEPAALVNAFLVAKVLPARQARLMFGGPARGEAPLGPRLVLSLHNFCVDVLRAGPAVAVRGASDTLEVAESREEVALPDYDEVTRVIARQLDAIRGGLPVQQGAPYRLALLLRHRLDWAGAFDGIRLPRTAGGDEVELTLSTMEGLTAWEDDELQARLGESVVPLGKVWELLRPKLLAAADRRLSSADVAGALRVPRDLWDQWVSRGRRRLRQQLGTDYAEVFAIWA